MSSLKRASEEAAKVLDTLAAVSVELSCHYYAPPHTLVLPASKVRETCDAIDVAVSALKKILAIAADEGQGPVP